MLECVVNVSEGRDGAVIAALAAAGGRCLLDVHSDAHHHRSVLTLAGDGVESAARAVTAEAVARLDLGRHVGVHPRLGVVDVVPFVPLEGSTMDDAVAARDRFLGLGGGRAGPARLRLRAAERSLPEVRRSAFVGAGTRRPARPRPTPPRAPSASGPGRCWWPTTCGWPTGWGSTRPGGWRRPCADRASVRALGLDVGGRAQVSMNLVDPSAVGPADAFDAVRALVAVDGAELVGLVPAAVLDGGAAERWAELDLDRSRTIEERRRL